MEVNGVSKNILWVDYAKFFGIFLMVFGHLIISGSHLYSFIYSFHMPLFFFLAGYLYRQKSKKENYLKIFWALLIPYLMYQFLYLPLRLFDLVILNGEPFRTTLVGCLNGILQAATVSNAPYILVCGPCWFIMVMIQLRLISNVIKITNKNLILLLISSFMVSKFLVVSKILLPCCLNCTFVALPYFILGILAKQNRVNFEKIHSKYFFVVYVFLLGFLMNLLLQHNGLVKISRPLEPMYNSDPSLLIMYIIAMIGIFMVILFSILFKKQNTYVDKISKNTLFIIFGQDFLLFFLELIKIPQKINAINILFVRYFLISLVAILVLGICYFCILFFERNFPLILGKYRYNKAK